MWIDLHKERFLAQRKSKLMPHADSPLCVLEKVNDNTYKLDLPKGYNVSPTFNPIWKIVLELKTVWI